MGKSKALETALNYKLLSSHEHLEKCVFSPTVTPCTYGDRGFSEFQRFQSWASSCIDIDIDIVDSVVVVITVYSIRL